MRLRTLQLHNYRRFRELLVEFPDGLIAVTGPNGAGKTTLIESIAWCLFGHDAARTEKDLLRRAAAAPGEDVLVRLEVDLEGSAVVVTRRLRGKSQQSEAQLELNGSLVVAPGANSSELATRHVARLLGMDRRGFHATVVAHQGDVSALSDTQPGERKRLVLQLLGVDEIDAAITQVRTQKRDASNVLEGLRRLLSHEGQLRERKDALETDLARSRSAQREALDAAARATVKLEVLSREASELAEHRARHQEVRQRLDGLQRALQAREEARARVGAELQLAEERGREWARLQDEAARFSDLDERLRAWEDERENRALRQRLATERERLVRELEKQGAHAAPQAGVGDAEAELHASRSRLEGIMRALAELDVHALHLEGEIRRLEADALDVAERWRELRDLGPEAPCPVCQRTLGDATHRLTSQAAQDQAHLRDRVEAARGERTAQALRAEALGRDRQLEAARLAALERRLGEERTRHEAHRLAQAHAERLRERLTTLESEVSALPAPWGSPGDADRLEALRKERDHWRSLLARLAVEAERAARLRPELASLAQHVEDTRREIGEGTRDLAQAPYVEGSWEAAQRAVDVERSRCHEIETRVRVLGERVELLERQLDPLRADLAQLDEARTEARVLEDRLRIGELLAADRGDQGVLPEFKRHLMSRVRPALARAASELVAEMTQNRYVEVTIDEDYAFRVFDGSQAWPLHRFSGGETDVINLAVRLAVSELLVQARNARRLRFVALDEVLAGQDEERRRNVLAALKRLSSHFRQVLLVTHLDEVRERVDHILRVTPRADGSSDVWCSWAEAAPESEPVALMSQASGQA